MAALLFANHVTAPPSPTGERVWLPSMLALRTPFAIAIFFAHVEILHVYPVRGAMTAVVGVTFFFVLSGFVLAWGFRPGTRPTDFFANRVGRIVPVYLAVMLFAVAVHVYVNGSLGRLGAALANLTMTQAWLPESVTDTYDGASWSLCCEMFLYLLLPLLVLYLARRSTTAGLLACGPLLAIPSALALSVRSWDSYLYTFPPARVGEFMLGVTLGIATRRGLRVRVPRLWALVLVLTTAAIIEIWQPPLLVSGAVTAPAFALMVLAFAGADLAGGDRPLRPPAAQYAGELTFAFYLVHMPMLQALTHRFHEDRLFLVPLGFALSFGLAVAVNLLVERPGRRLVSACWHRLRAQRSASPACP